MALPYKEWKYTDSDWKIYSDDSDVLSFLKKCKLAKIHGEYYNTHNGKRAWDFIVLSSDIAKVRRGIKAAVKKTMKGKDA